MPVPPKVDLDQGDKVGHFAAYGLLMFVFCQIYELRSTRLAYALAFTAMGIALEFLQGMTDYRTFEVLDMIGNTVGVALGWIAGAAFARYVRIHR
jgi:VanZ family protein